MLAHIKNKQSSTAEHSDPLTKKWLEIEKKQKRNANFKRKITDLYQIFQDDILQEEHKLIELLGQETQHLMSFMSRKSFTEWQKEELHGWIESNLETLSEHPFGNAELANNLRKEYSNALLVNTKEVDENIALDKDVIAEMRALCEEMFEGEISFSDEELSDFIRDPALFQQAFQEFLANKHTEEADEFEEGFSGDDSEDDHYHEYYQQQEESKKDKQQDKLKSLFNSSKLNKLYKILANRLHPDKERNEHLKAEKSALMAQLVKAKKNKDAYTIISMFHQFMPESELNFFDGSDEELTQALIKLLNEKLRELDQENKEQKYNNGLESMIWQKLSGRSKKATQENIDCHLADLEDSHTRLNYYIHEVKTVKLLKEILSERYEKNSFNPFANGHFSLDDLAEMFR
ncbi:MAG: hypothetical protein COB45_08675 [Gammaproteobacteria bacterium]|nr:MAG: hypothetical protein COB45_08675 [Gammaproteobacteria bacterium]